MYTANAKRTYYQPLEWKKLKNIQETKPRLDSVVNVENCYYYMSLLEEFYNVEQSMSDELFKLYIIAAERRYLEFIRYCGTGNYLQHWSGGRPVPIDIAYAWHAHLLAPYHYKEDILCDSANVELPWKSNFPLEAMVKKYHSLE
ncbi:hypothetical protein BDA99DRAFT_249500 [Phascolomyces articulosus]|uniref:Uncharacterized protein n=1 Tax=Phascolomyces articulosus TaxID=60185 RepID=A0AAD5K8Z9_9FUNG|nr:hypothetical protein BDA99DRAFT_249500 [Phascolomyces articulosus]